MGKGHGCLQVGERADGLGTGSRRAWQLEMKVAGGLPAFIWLRSHHNALGVILAVN
jgi:hypothetical protein